VDIDPDFAEVFIDEDHLILGRWLRPFCLWHLFLLQTLKSPLLGGGGSRVAPFDLRTAVGACCTGFRESIIKRPWIGAANFACYRRKAFQREVAKFLDYIDDHLHRPEFNVISTAHSAIRGQPPEILRVAAEIASTFHWTRKEIFEMPIGEAYWWEAMSIRSKCDTDFMTPEEREFQRQLKEHHPGLAGNGRGPNGSR
jgi:hypothetical protein